MCSVQGLMYIKLQPTNKRNRSLSRRSPKNVSIPARNYSALVPFRSPDRRPRGGGG